MANKGIGYSSGRMMSPFLSYFSQSIPLIMNVKGTVTSSPSNVSFIASNHSDGAIVKPFFTDIGRVAKVYILLLGRAVNQYNGRNFIDGGSANQWQININGGSYYNLENLGKGDGAFGNGDLDCYAQGLVHPFTMFFDITERITALDNRIGLRLQSAEAIQNSLDIIVDVYTKITWRM